MALLNFKYGAQSTLPAQFTAGTVYITTDTKHMYVDLPETGNKHLSIGNFQLVEYSSGTAATALSNYAIKETNVLYIALNTASKDTALYRYDGTNFVAVSNTAEISALVARLDSIDGSISALESEVDGKAPKAHAVNANTYGLGTNGVYGHVKLSDSTTSTSGQTAGIAATPAAVKSAYDQGTKGVNDAKAAKGAADAAQADATKALSDAAAAKTAANNAQDEVDALEGVVAGKAPINHSSATTDYGVGSGTNYGHLKLSDATDGTASVSSGTAATPKAVAAAYAKGSQGITDAAAAKKAADAAATAASEANANANNRVSKSGDTMTGALTLSGAPTANLHAATKLYVDEAKDSAINTASADATNKANAVLGDSNDTATVKTVYGAHAAAAEARSAANTAKETADAKAPKNHASSATTYGVGTTSLYGHVKLSDTASTGNAVAQGVAATPKAVADAKAAVIGASGDAATKTTVYGAKKYTDEAIATVNSTINTLKDNIGNLSNIMNFLGVTTTALSDGASTKEIVINNQTVTAKAGDVVVVSNSIVGDSTIGDFVLSEGKEFVFDGSIWHEIGDTVAQSTAISNLQSKVNTIEGNVSSLTSKMTTAEASIQNLQQWKASHSTEYNNLKSRVTTAESEIDGLQASVGTRPNAPTMDTTLWEEVADLRSDLGESSAASGTGSAFARIKKAETSIGASGDAASATGSLYARIAKNKADIATNATNINNNSDAINNLITVLTWGNWDA